jgi:hypothetical protein
MKLFQIGQSVNSQLVRIAMSGYGQISNVLAYPLTRVGQHLVIQGMDQPAMIRTHRSMDKDTLSRTQF